MFPQKSQYVLGCRSESLDERYRLPFLHIFIDIIVDQHTGPVLISRVGFSAHFFRSFV